MAYSIVAIVAAIVSQAGEPASKPSSKPETKAAAATQIKDARRLLQNGRYAEADEAYRAVESAAKKEPAGLTPELKIAVGLGKAECLASQGEYSKAIAELTTLAAQEPKNADVKARLANLYLIRGDWPAAETAMRLALALNADHLLARWVEARLLELHGELDKSVAACKCFVDQFNDKKPDIARNADALILVGQAAERYYRATARGEELKDSLVNVITEIYEAALAADPNCWQAPWLIGRLYLSGYNERAATPVLARAQQINPLAPEVLVTLGQSDLEGYRLAQGRAKAERTLSINPHYAAAYVLQADLNISDERFVEAKASAESRRREST